MKKYPSIEQFRHVIKKVKGRCQYEMMPRPELKFHGSVKLHGTNASIVLHPHGSYEFQSRNGIIDPETDNDTLYGFTTFASVNVDKIIDGLYIRHESEPIVIYGEWCGEGIQSNVAISQLPKMFVIFSIRYGDEWIDADVDPSSILNLDLLNEIGVFHINQFKTYTLSIDFEHPELSQNMLRDITLSVEEECPVGKFFNIIGTGEGVVWKCVEPGYRSSNYWFKVKGAKHSPSKVKTLPEVDVEKINNIKVFVENTVTEQRLMQGIEFLKEMNFEISIKSTGKFISWVFCDILKEESDVIEASGFRDKDINPLVGKKSREWFFQYLEENVEE